MNDYSDGEKPWTNSALTRLGKRIRDGGVTPDVAAEYSEVMAWYNDLAIDVQARIESLDFTSLLGADAVVEITSRAKTIDTLGDKLRRDRGMALPSIQDIAGVRVDASMTLTQQMHVAQAIAELFDHGARAVKDLRSAPHSGYRALHVWLRLRGRVEVQVRTVFQSEWANAYESIADLLGREIRYDEYLPDNADAAELVRAMRTLSSEEIAGLEVLLDAIPVANVSSSDFLSRVRELAIDRGVAPDVLAAIEKSSGGASVQIVLEEMLTASLRVLRYGLTGLPREEG